MKNLLDLRNQYYSILSQAEAISAEIGDVLEEEFEYKGNPCRVTQYGIDDDLIWIESNDGTWISDSGGDKQVLSFEEFMNSRRIRPQREGEI